MSLLTMHMQDLNPHIMCVLCGGYLVDATTIVECLHSFCRSCIVKYLQSSYHCPVCDAEVHKTKPLLHIRPDRTLQDIVYKIVPGIYHEEVTRRKEFETIQKDKNEPAIEGTMDDDTASNEKEKDHLPFDDPVCITLEYFSLMQTLKKVWENLKLSKYSRTSPQRPPWRQRKTRNRMEKEVFPTRYLRCSSEVTVKVLKKFLVMKFAIPETHNTEITRSDEILNDHLTMKEVCRIYGLYSKPFVYVFLEKKDSTTSVEKPKILDVKRKRIKKKKKGNKSLLKKCLGPNTPHRLKNKTGKKKDLSSAQPSENAQKLGMEPSQPRPLENEKKEILVLSPIQLCANVKKEDLVSSKEPPCDKVEYDNNVKEPSLSAQFYHNCDKARDSLLQPNMDNQHGGFVIENEASVLGKSTVRRFHQQDLVETLVNSNLKAVDSSSTVTPISFPEPARFWPAMNGESGEEFSITPAVNDLKHAQSDESYYAKEMEMDTSVSNYTNDICMNHISTDLESSAAMLRRIGVLLESL